MFFSSLPWLKATSSHFEFYLAVAWSWRYHISSSFLYVSPQYPKWSLKFIEPPGSEMWAQLFVGLDLLTQESSWCGSYSCPGTAGGPSMEISGRRLFLNEFLSEGSTRPGRENNDKEKTNRAEGWPQKDNTTIRKTALKWSKPLNVISYSTITRGKSGRVSYSTITLGGRDCCPKGGAWQREAGAFGHGWLWAFPRN